jgi:hypothetical protein
MKYGNYLNSGEYCAEFGVHDDSIRLDDSERSRDITKTADFSERLRLSVRAHIKIVTRKINGRKEECLRKKEKNV